MGGLSAKSPNIWEISRKPPAGMLIAEPNKRPGLFIPVFGILLVLRQQKGLLTTGGRSTRLVQERKAENEECL